MRNIMILGASLISLAACEKTNHCDDPDGAMPYIMSQTFVERRLRSPSTADFPSFHDSQVRSNQTSRTGNECVFAVDGYVDAQNGFGATVRSRFFAEIQHDAEDGMWTALNVAIY